MKMKEKTCCFTGHRKIPPEKAEFISRRLREVIVELINRGYLYFGAGGAMGFDTLAAQTVLELKIEYPKIKLILVLPCLSQDKYWSDNDKAIYNNIKSEADKIVFVSEDYTRDCMFRRNRHLVDNSSVCICYLTEQSGGTFYTVKYARSEGVRVINVAKAL